jgi:hypothetical protein
MEESSIKNAPYPPSLMNRFTSWVKRQPIPSWLFYVVLLIVWELIAFLLAWAAGDLQWGAVDFQIFFNNFWGVGMLVFHHYIESEISAALRDSKPLLNISSGGFSELEYEFTIMPARQFLALSIIFLATGAFFGVSQAGFAHLSPPFLLQTLLYGLQGVVVLGFFYRLIRLIGMITNLYASPVTINLFDLAPVYELSALGAKAGLLILIFLYLSLVANPGSLTDPQASPYRIGTALFTMVPLAAFFLPLRGINRRLVKEKRTLMSDVSHRLEFVLDQIRHTVESGDLESIGDLETALKAMERDKDLVEKISTWPWRPTTLRVLLSAVFLPMFLWAIQQFLNRFFDF